MSGAQTVVAQRNQARSERMFGRLEAPGGSAFASAPHTGLDPFLSDQEVPDLSMPNPPDIHRPVPGDDFMPYGHCGGCETCRPAPLVCALCSYRGNEYPTQKDAVLWPCEFAKDGA